VTTKHYSGANKTTTVSSRRAGKQVGGVEPDSHRAVPTADLRHAAREPGALSPGQVLTLQRSLGNRGVQRLLARDPARGTASESPAGDRREPAARPARETPGAAAVRPSPSAGNVVQRFVSREDQNTVYMPATFNIEGEFRASLQALLGNHQIRQMTWTDFSRQIAWPGATGWEIPRAALAAWASANLGTGRSESERDPSPDYQSPDVDNDTMTTVRQHFHDETSVYKYANQHSLQWGNNDNGRALLLRPGDMREQGTDLVALMNEPEACVIQALEDFNVNVPGTTNHGVQDWHQYCRTNHLDYRTDSHYIRLYVETLGYTLVHNTVAAWNAIDWNALGGDGNYLVSSYPNGQPVGGEVGHMIGVVIAGGVPHTIHDQQQLTEPYLAGGNVHARYIFRM
jgi:hypothetical protein